MEKDGLFHYINLNFGKAKLTPEISGINDVFPWSASCDPSLAFSAKDRICCASFHVCSEFGLRFWFGKGEERIFEVLRRSWVAVASIES
ncbi:hypothetical protein HPP92_025943 [Vanilla planifolia]|uniref:Uncharacterized protein n=1 Tax=Vanilla planifolia TaxID=51239 RepID=A0A835U881_VANPL|nr:hypothetical protein HPP92_025943 [Vanilla planifolia]